MEIDVNQTILIVVGVDIEPEEADRPLAYKLKSVIEASPRFGGHPFRKCIVISDALYEHDKLIQVCPTIAIDALYEHDKLIQVCPTIAIGGPGVNAVAGVLVEKLPVYLSKNNRYFIQLDKDFIDQKISIWGMDRDSTAESIEMFIANGILDDFLKTIWG